MTSHRSAETAQSGDQTTISSRRCRAGHGRRRVADRSQVADQGQVADRFGRRKNRPKRSGIGNRAPSPMLEGAVMGLWALLAAIVAAAAIGLTLRYRDGRF